MRTLRRVGSPLPSLGNTLSNRRPKIAASRDISPADLMPAVAEALRAIAPPPANIAVMRQAVVPPPPPLPQVHEVRVVPPRNLQNQRALIAAPESCGFLSELNRVLSVRRGARAPSPDIVSVQNVEPESRRSSFSSQDWNAD